MADFRETNPDSSTILLVQYTATEESRAVSELMGEPDSVCNTGNAVPWLIVQVVDKKLRINVEFLAKKNDSLSANVLHDEEPTWRCWFSLIKYLG